MRHTSESCTSRLRFANLPSNKTEGRFRLGRFAGPIATWIKEKLSDDDWFFTRCSTRHDGYRKHKRGIGEHFKDLLNGLEDRFGQDEKN